MRSFLPSPRETNVLLLLGFTALGCSIYLRVNLVESGSLLAACASGTVLAGCSVRKILIELSEMQFFGGVALATAILHFRRPGLRLFAVALAAAIFGLFMDNVPASAFATAILVIAFARPQRANMHRPEPPAQRPARPPASSAATR